MTQKTAKELSNYCICAKEAVMKQPCLECGHRTARAHHFLCGVCMAKEDEREKEARELRSTQQFTLSFREVVQDVPALNWRYQ